MGFAYSPTTFSSLSFNFIQVQLSTFCNKAFIGESYSNIFSNFSHEHYKNFYGENLKIQDCYRDMQKRVTPTSHSFDY